MRRGPRPAAVGLLSALALFTAVAHAGTPRVRLARPAARTTVIRVGLLSPVKGTRRAESAALRRGAELAAAEVNGGAHGWRLQLLERPDDGLWGAGVRQLTDLAFTERVSALMGGVESESAHLIEQAAQKARTVYLMPWTGDRTLTQAGVPWVFSCVPNDEQRGTALVREAFGARHLQRVGILLTADRTARLQARQFVRVAAKGRHPLSPKLAWQMAPQLPGAPDPLAPVLDRVAGARPQAVVLFAPMESAAAIVPALRRRIPGLVVLQPRLPAAPGHAFYRRYRARYGSAAAPPAAFAYDAVRVLARALSTLPADRLADHEAIRSALTKVRYRGATGEIRFDRRGNRVVP